MFKIYRMLRPPRIAYNRRKSTIIVRGGCCTQDIIDKDMAEDWGVFGQPGTKMKVGDS